MKWGATSSALVLAGVLVLATSSAQAAPGALDPSFGSGGKVVTGVGSALDFGEAVALQSDGKIVVAGFSFNGASFDFALVRYNVDGSLDSAFGSGGKVTTSFGPNSDSAAAVALQPDGKIVAAGQSYNGSDTDFALARYNPDGSLDSSFGVGGKVTTSIRSKSDGVLTIALQPDGKIVAGGYSEDSTFTDDFALARYNADGSLDTSFGTGGEVVTVIGSDHDDINSVQLQPDGKIVAVGYGKPSTTYQFALVRYTATGSLDSSFGSGGMVTTSIGSLDDEAYGGALQPDGKIVAGGFTKVGPNRYFALARYNSDGSLDAGFGTGGKVTTPIGTSDSVNELALQPDGRIVAAGYASSGTNDDFALARYNVDGSLDPAFGSGGKVTTAVVPDENVANAVALQADGKIVAAGLAYNGTDYDFALARYLGSTLTVAKAGAGTGTVTSSPAGINCGSACSAPFAAVPVTLTATASAGSTFTGWSGDCTGTGTCNLTMSADHAVTATFETDKTLTVTKIGSGSGSVSSSPAGIDCGSTCSHAYAHGTSVTLTAAAVSGSSFTGWSGDCSGTGTCTLAMSADHSATAGFKLKPKCVVPKVKGKKLAAAKRAIRRAHCSVGKVRKAFSARVRKGRVISQKPAPGKKLAPGARVNLKVSKGKKT